MKSLLPSHFKELKIIDEVLGDFVNEKLNFTNQNFYSPTEQNAFLIAQTFDINILGFNLNQIIKILQTPMLSKSRLGTKEALKTSLNKVFGEVVIQSIQEDNKLKPFEFSIKANVDNGIDEEGLMAIKSIVEETKPLRASLAGIDFEMPCLQCDILLKNSILWRL
ncbi:phage tail protein [Helicobacter sp. 13S00477-4]|uniref:phage tail protein n=1 Tax=Helicobacter sp. 13S00477-4 TaxID=1905759 RepID=UPI000BA4E913|nr:phage tail protein [Helicobacter sp. 13S00477-4]PAF50850.1 hypothetical protein BKH44_06795 [Helicobacter sp. 13S00477-4]